MTEESPPVLCLLCPCRTVLGLFGLGSVSDYVVKHAGCNVIVHKSAAAVASGPTAT